MLDPEVRETVVDFLDGMEAGVRELARSGMATMGGHLETRAKALRAFLADHDALSSLLAEAGRVIGPFAGLVETEAGEPLIEDIMRDRICDWMGPSDFRAARAFLNSLDGGLEKGVSPTCDDPALTETGQHGAVEASGREPG